MYNVLKAKGETWVLNQSAPFLIDGVEGIITEIYETSQFVGIEISINDSGIIYNMKVPIVNKELDDYETVPSSQKIKEGIENYERETAKSLGKVG